jgi:hypothetical protein
MARIIIDKPRGKKGARDRIGARRALSPHDHLGPIGGTDCCGNSICDGGLVGYLKNVN